MQTLLTHDVRPTAVFVASDVVAFGAVQAIHHHGLRIPEDIAVVGFDDVPLANYCTPPLTTVRMPAAEMGRRAGELLLERIAGQPTERHLMLETELVMRASSTFRL
jgi:LacI family transcriptional regulator